MRIAGSVARIVVPGLLLMGCAQEPKLTTSSPEALRLYAEGVSLWEKFYYREAIDSFNAALARD